MTSPWSILISQASGIQCNVDGHCARGYECVAPHDFSAINDLSMGVCQGGWIPLILLHLQWRHNGVSNQQHLDCLLSCLIRRTSKTKAPRYWSLWGESTGDQWTRVPSGVWYFLHHNNTNTSGGLKWKHIAYHHVATRATLNNENCANRCFTIDKWHLYYVKTPTYDPLYYIHCQLVLYIVSIWYSM